MSHPHHDITAQADTELAALLVDLSEYAAMAAEAISDPQIGMRGGDRVQIARNISLTRLHVLTAALRADRAHGATWAELTEALGEHRSVEQVTEHYGPTVEPYLAGMGGTPNLPGLSARLGIYVSRIPPDWRAAARWLGKWRSDRRERDHRAC